MSSKLSLLCHIHLPRDCLQSELQWPYIHIHWGKQLLRSHEQHAVSQQLHSSMLSPRIAISTKGHLNMVLQTTTQGFFGVVPLTFGQHHHQWEVSTPAYTYLTYIWKSFTIIIIYKPNGLVMQAIMNLKISKCTDEDRSEATKNSERKKKTDQITKTF